MALKSFFKNYFFIILITSLLVSSCVSKKEILYFQDIETLNTEMQLENHTTVIRPNDLLSITVTSQDPAAVAIFNPSLGNNGTGVVESGVGKYLVDADGNIEFPYLGTINIGNKSRKDAIALLQEGINVYVKEAVINLRILNFTVSVLGEVAVPGNFTIPDERLTVLEALGLAGDMTIFGERKTVKVIREQDGKRSYGNLDFTSIDVVNSPFFYLQQNDVIIVSPNNAQVQSAGFNRNTGVFISIAGILIAVVTLFTR